MSQLDSESKTIGGHQFKVFKLPPLVAQDVLIDIGKVVAPALGNAASAMGGAQGANPLDLDVEDPRIGTAIGTLAGNISKQQMRDLVATMADVTHCDGTPLPRVQEAIFRGDLPLMYQWLWFSLQVNYGNFTGWLGSGIAGLTAKAKDGQSQPTSSDTGQQ